MLTAIVLYLHDNQPGPGFFTDAQTLGMLAAGDLSSAAKEQFWRAQVEAVHAAYRRGQRARRGESPDRAWPASAGLAEEDSLAGVDQPYISRLEHGRFGPALARHRATFAPSYI
jgi:hypothetical protein